MARISTLMLCFLVALSCLDAWGNVPCPDYNSIRQPSVQPNVFNITEFSGHWYMVATNEPTMPSFCRCGTNDVTVNAAAGTYGYVNRDYCDHIPGNKFSITIKGELSTDPESPGELHETAAIFNHTLGSLLPNLIFKVIRSPSGEISTIFTYACLGKIFGIGSDKYSFNVLSRTNSYSLLEIMSMVNSAMADTGGQLDISGLRISNLTTYKACGVSLV